MQYLESLHHDPSIDLLQVTVDSIMPVELRYLPALSTRRPSPVIEEPAGVLHDVKTTLRGFNVIEDVTITPYPLFNKRDTREAPYRDRQVKRFIRTP